ncbi:hypothetical protein AB0O07_06175 [Streptomyces sp. NPDC093085]|uniref:hypothetical protein n=1 Tax=Streptomyces sp. NPDC093085 TaxID=3155068 RepID=UPI00343C5352
MAALPGLDALAGANPLVLAAGVNPAALLSGGSPLGAIGGHGASPLGARPAPRRTRPR